MSRKEREEAEKQFKNIRERKPYKELRKTSEQIKRKYKTVFQVVIETTASNIEQAESEALKQLIKFVGEKETSQIISRNYPVTTEIRPLFK